MNPFRLSLPKPCRENWDRMTPEDKGRFCAACQKTVVDFSTMSDQRIAEYFKTADTGVCGRFDQSQLNRVIDVPRRRLPWLRHLLAASLPAFLFSLKSGAQGQVGKMGKIAVCRPTVKGDTVVTPAPENLDTMKGVVRTENGDPLLNASVQIRGMMEGATTGENGTFQIRQTSGAHIEVVVSAPGYETQVIPFCAAGPVTITLTTKTYLVLGEVARGEPKKKPVVIPMLQPQKTETAFSKFSVFPNPVAAGGAFILDAKDLDEGRYLLQLVTSTGEVVRSKELSVEKEARKQSIEVGCIAAGPYFVRLMNRKSGTSYSEIILVQ